MDSEIIKTAIKACDTSLLSTVVGVVLGSCIFARWQERRSNRIATLRWIIQKVDEYEDVSLHYWNKFVSDGNRSDKCVYESRMKNDPSLISGAITKVLRDYRSKKVCDELLRLVRKLKKAATGGPFECAEITPVQAQERMQETAVAAGKVVEALYVQVHECQPFMSILQKIQSRMKPILRSMRQEGISI